MKQLDIVKKYEYHVFFLLWILYRYINHMCIMLKVEANFPRWMEVIWGVDKSAEFGDTPSTVWKGFLWNYTCVKDFLWDLASRIGDVQLKCLREKRKEGEYTKAGLRSHWGMWLGSEKENEKLKSRCFGCLLAVHRFQLLSPHCAYFIGFCEVPT